MATVHLIWKNGCLKRSSYPKEPIVVTPVTPCKLSTLVCVENDVVLRYKNYDYKMVYPVTMGFDRYYGSSRSPFPSSSSFISVRFDPIPTKSKKNIPFPVAVSANDFSDDENPVSSIREVNFGSPESPFYKNQSGKVNIDDYLKASGLILSVPGTDTMPFKDIPEASKGIILPRYVVSIAHEIRDGLGIALLDPNTNIMHPKFSSLKRIISRGNYAIKFHFNNYWNFDTSKVHYIKGKDIIYVSGSDSHSRNKTFTNACTLILSEGKDDSINLKIIERSFVTL